MTPGGVPAKRSRGAESPPSPCCFWCSPGYGWLSGLWAHTGSLCPAFHPPVPPSRSPQGCSQSFHPPACIDSRSCSDPDADHCTSPYWSSWGSHRLTSRACPGKNHLEWYIHFLFRSHKFIAGAQWRSVVTEGWRIVIYTKLGCYLCEEYQGGYPLLFWTHGVNETNVQLIL